ncbi:hypothetical protein OKA05_01040 [Luteolibacter arcticus]|uniref:DUF4175 domain-containing protein n=1 Tax=Luteolibacter arcticus TaxID=1581411 RepID=A0ABT3GBV9_9BACT|nr:hypothetical protein [Luteolibacter arcticus]MCW1921117.1 hypothetical protein [Luteolibacter arcticus]
MNPSSPVLAPLASLAKARRRHARGIAFAGIIAAVVAVAGIVAALDTWLEWKSPARSALVAALATVSIVLLAKRLRLAKIHDTMEAARVIETAHPEIGQKLRTALEVSSRPSANDPDAAYFTDRLMRETGKDLTQAPWSRLVPAKQLWRRRAMALAACATVALVALLWGDFRHALKRIVQPHRDLTYTTVEWKSLPTGFDERHPPRLEFTVNGRAAQPELLVRQGGKDWKPVELTRREDGQTWDVVFTGKTTDLEVKVVAGDARVEEKTIAYRPIPKLVESKATIAYPDYTGLEAETVAGGDVRTVEGSTATWDFTFNARPDRITWSIGGAMPVELSAKDGATYSISSEVVAGKAQGELAIFHADGERLDAWRFEIEGVVDKLPVVEIVEPTKDLELIATAEMPIRIRAKDDFGVAEIGLILDAAGERRWIVETVIDAKNQRQVSEIAQMMLDQIPLKITDNVRIHAYALDHKPRGGPRAVSPLRSVDIRQFQMRWYFAGGGDGDGGDEEEEGPDDEAVSDALMKLDQIIGSQRGILSDVFQTKESFRSNLTPEALTKTVEQATREQELASETQRTAMDWEQSGELDADDVALLGTAGIQMAEAAGFLEMPDLAKGFDTADRALSTLLQLRKELIKIIGKGKKPSEPKDPPPPPLTEFAKEARRIAAEEKDVAGQIAPEAVEGNNIEATRRQQEVALADSGELFAKLVDHPERTDGALRLMDEAEKAVAKADKTLRSESPAHAAPELGVAEQDLLDFAIFLESMDLQKLSDTLRKLADNAEKNAKEQKKGDQPAPAEGEKPGESPGESPAQAQAKGQGKGKGEGQGQGEGEGQGDSSEQATAAKEGEGQGKGQEGQKPGEAAAEAAQATDLTHKILEELAKKANAGQAEDPEAPKTPSASALEAVKERTDVAKLAKDLESLAQALKDGQGNAEQQAELAERLGAMAREFRDAAASLDASLLAELNKAREQAAELKKDLAKQGEGKNPGEGKGEGQKPGESGQGAVASKDGKRQGQGEKPGENGEGEGKGQGEGEKPGQGGQGEMASRDGKGDKPGEGQGQGQGEIASKEGKGQGPGDKPGDKPGSGGEEPGMGGPSLGRFADTLERLRDEGVGRMVLPLRAAPFDRSTIPLVDAADQRLKELIDRIPTDAGIASARGKLPEESRREIEDYFRDLSDDFGGEVWETKQ